MIPYSSEPRKFLHADGVHIPSFLTPDDRNLDPVTVASFGDEWTRFSLFSEEDIRIAGEQYFDIVTPDMLGPEKTALDIGCGTGRWSLFLASRIGFIEAVDPSSAVFSAARLTAACGNIRVTQAGVDNLPFADAAFDFVFSLGVMHHLPDTQEAIRKAVAKLKPGGHFLIYLYYSLDNRSGGYRFLFRLTNLLRKVISRFPSRLKQVVCDLIAVLVYLPFAGLARIIRSLFPRKNWYRRLPLSYYHDKGFYIIRNDALDRMGTPLEHRFSRKQIEAMLRSAGLEQIVFSESEPFWHAVGKKPHAPSV
jgi:SAM-dependent methyltransferase